MTKSAKNPKVDFYFSKVKQWKMELEKLRKIILDCGLTEELKWGHPCYALEKRNIVHMDLKNTVLFCFSKEHC